MSDALIETRNLSKCFNEGELLVEVLKGIDFTIESNRSVAIIGTSGSGKSTLLHILGGLDTPDKGEVLINNEDMGKLNDKQRGDLRNQYLGFVYQFHHLLNKVGLSKRAQHKPGELSGGERQRAAIARALVSEPSCILADEPTGNLDEKTADQVFDLILELNQSLSTSLIMVTHNMELSRRADRVFELKEGLLEAQ